MLEIYSRDRETDFEFFVFDGNNIEYKTIDSYDLDEETKSYYRSLDEGTIILDGTPISKDNITKEQADYIYSMAELDKEKYKAIKKDYTPRYLKVNVGSSISKIVDNARVIEVPDIYNIQGWIYITGYELLQNFITEYERQSNKGTKPRRKLFDRLFKQKR